MFGLKINGEPFKDDKEAQAAADEWIKENSGWKWSGKRRYNKEEKQNELQM